MSTPITTALLPPKKNSQKVNPLSHDDKQKNIKKIFVVKQPNAGLLITATTTGTDSRSSLPTTSTNNIVSSSANYPSISSFLQPRSRAISPSARPNRISSPNLHHHHHQYHHHHHRLELNQQQHSYPPHMGYSFLVDYCEDDGVNSRRISY